MPAPTTTPGTAPADPGHDQLAELSATLQHGIDQLTRNITAIGPAVAAAAGNPLLPGFVVDAVAWCAERLVDAATSILHTITDAVQGIAAPVVFFRYAYDWQTVRGAASTVSGQLKPDTLPATGRWSGRAATAYTNVIKPQADAANRLATIADRTAFALNASATAGVAFYIALGAILIKIIEATAAALIAFGSEVFSWAGALLILEEAAVSGSMLTALIALLAAALATQAGQLATLHGEAVDNSTFPAGAWPDPVVDRYADATVTDGDADWSLAAQ